MENSIRGVLAALVFLVITAHAPANESEQTITIKGSDTLGAKMVPQLIERWKAEKETPSNFWSLQRALQQRLSV